MNDSGNHQDEAGMYVSGQRTPAGAADVVLASGEDPSLLQDTRFVLIVAAMLCVIMVSLAGLWLLERKKRNQAEQDFVRLQAESQKMNKIFATGMAQSLIVRADLSTQEMNIDGKSRQVLLLSSYKGAAIGLEPGDMVLVTKPPKISKKPDQQPKMPGSLPANLPLPDNFPIPSK